MSDTKYLEQLRTYWKKHHAFPSMAKLCEVAGMSSTASVFDLVNRLKDEGYVQQVEGRIAPTKRFFASPLTGHVRAGVPQPRQEDDDFEALTIDDYLVPDPNRTFLARVKGDSMRDASLLDGDMVVVQKNAPTRVGGIVVAVVDGQVTVKHLRQQPDGRFYLQAANTAFADILPTGSSKSSGSSWAHFARTGGEPTKHSQSNAKPLGPRQSSCSRRRTDREQLCPKPSDCSLAPPSARGPHASASRRATCQFGALTPSRTDRT